MTALTDERRDRSGRARDDSGRFISDLVSTRERRLFGFCVYCGEPSYGLACRGHRDLLLLDPNQYLLRLRRPIEGAPA